MTLLSTLNVTLLVATAWIDFWNWVWPTVMTKNCFCGMVDQRKDTMDWAGTWIVNFKKKSACFIWDNCGAIDLKIDGSVLEKKSSYVWTVIIVYVGLWFLHCLTC